ncbi:hypothetical protein D3C71_1658880 [compost metagenome]
MEMARERDREIREERKRFEESAEGRYWHWLMEQVHGDGCGFAGLSVHDQRYFAINALISDVYRGGLDAYFHNSAGGYIAEALAGLDEIKQLDVRDIVLAAQRLLFGNEAMEDHHAQRRLQIYRADGHLSDEAHAALDALDGQFCALVDDGQLEELLKAYAERHRLYAAF